MRGWCDINERTNNSRKSCQASFGVHSTCTEGSMYVCMCGQVTTVSGTVLRWFRLRTRRYSGSERHSMRRLRPQTPPPLSSYVQRTTLRNILITHNISTLHLTFRCNAQLSNFCMCWLCTLCLSLIHIWRCRRIERCRSRWSPYH